MECLFYAFRIFLVFACFLCVISINLPYIHVCNTVVYVWAGTPSCYLELLDELQKRTFRTVGPSLAASLESLVHCRNVVSLFYRFYFGICSSELAQLCFTSFFLRKIYSLF